MTYKIKRKFLILASLILIFGVSGSGVGSTAPEKNIPAFQSKELAPISIYDEKNLLEISIEDIGKFHGDICPCVVVAFRATQLAISQIWGEEIPRREDFEIISAHPGQGSQDVFEFICRAKTRGAFILALPRGTDKENLTMENWVFTFIRKSTNERVKVRVKKEMFPGGATEFFDLRKKVEFKRTATTEKKETFASAMQKLTKLFISLPVNKLFVFEKKKGTE